MREEFEDFNVLAYHAMQGAALDVVIWCLGPLVDDSREYGPFRLYLAAATRELCRWHLRRRGYISPTD